MKHFIFKSSLIVAMIVMAGCGYKQQNIQKGDTAFLKFTTTKPYTVVINDNLRFEIKDEKDKSYAIKSGKNHIKIYQGENLIYDKDIYVGLENTKIINLP